ncbi:ankyrin repeat and zinc finger domain containing 1, partial [Chelydra serpentina]
PSEEEGSPAGELETVEVTLGTLQLREFEVMPKRSRKRRKKRDKVGRGENGGFPRDRRWWRPCQPHSRAKPSRPEGLTWVCVSVYRLPCLRPWGSWHLAFAGRGWGQLHAPGVGGKVLAPDHVSIPLPVLPRAGARTEGPGGHEEPEHSAPQPGAETVADPQEGPWAEPAALGKGGSLLGPLRDALFTACKTGDAGTLRRLLGAAESGAPPAGSEDGAGGQPGRGRSEGAAPGLLSLLGEPLDRTGFTLLHVAAAAGKGLAVRLLLEAGADPALRDRQERPPYCVSADKSTRNVFRKFMVDHPAKYDYGRAKVPGPLTAEMEARRLEKQRAQKAQRKQRAQELRGQQQRLAQEEEEKRHFAALPDREKRALAAERRLAAQLPDTGAALANTRRCWQCGASLLGRIPFHYLDFSFCSTGCLQAHRRARAGPT